MRAGRDMRARNAIGVRSRIIVLHLPTTPHDPSHRREMQAEMLGDLLVRVGTRGMSLLDGAVAIRRTFGNLCQSRRRRSSMGLGYLDVPALSLVYACLHFLDKFVVAEKYLSFQIFPW